MFKLKQIEAIDRRRRDENQMVQPRRYFVSRGVVYAEIRGKNPCPIYRYWHGTRKGQTQGWMYD